MTSSSSSIYIGGFPDTWGQNEILTLCSAYGPIKSAKVETNKMGKPFAIVSYAARKNVKDIELIKCGNPAEEAVHELDGGRFMGKRIRARMFVPSFHVYRYAKEEDDTFSDTASVMTTDTTYSTKKASAVAVPSAPVVEAGFWSAFDALTIGEAKAPKLVVILPEPKKKEEEKKEEGE
jgi:RNA recognition motif-containing protein